MVFAEQIARLADEQTGRCSRATGRRGLPSHGDDWEEVWDARADALAQMLGPGHDQVYHAPHPFELGGQADVLAFFHHLDGAVYVTAELTGKPDACYTDYELMICHRSPQDWGPNAISRLAPYTQEASIGAGETMDIDSATPANSRIKAFLFHTYKTFTLFGHECELRLCLGITKAELQYKPVQDGTWAEEATAAVETLRHLSVYGSRTRQRAARCLMEVA